MGRFESYDGTGLAYRESGDGPPLVCLPGGPGRAAAYLGDLGGLDAARRLILLDPRGVGDSDDASDPAAYRVDRLVRDVEALRVHLGLERMDLLAHSAGAVLGTLYAAAYPERVSRLILVTPGLAAVGVHASEEEVRAVLDLRAAEPWYAEALAGLERIFAGDLSREAFTASRPLCYARWDAAAEAHAALGTADRHQAARAGYFADVVLDPPAVRAAVAAPVLLYGGALDPLVPPPALSRAATAFHNAKYVVAPNTAHFPWIDTPAAFADSLTSFLT